MFGALKQSQLEERMKILRSQKVIPDHLTQQAELNAWEAGNIAEIPLWLSKKKLTLELLLTLDFIKKLHLKMFGKTWEWAGAFRKTELNLGVEYSKISTELTQTIEDVKFWIKNETFTFDEIAARFHHKLVFIHPFPNGNGRFSRLYTDLFLKIKNCLPFSWGKKNLIKSTEDRKKYIHALQAADRHDYSELVEFVRS